MAASCNEAGYGVFVREFRPGMTESDVMSFMAQGIYAAGAEYIEGWVVNSGIRAAPRNYNASDRTVRPGELISIEACHATYCGYKVCYDRTFLIAGKPTPIQKELYDVTAELHYKIMDILKPGLSAQALLKTKPHPPKTLKTLQDIKDLRETYYTNHLGGMGIRWDAGPNYSRNEPEIILEKNMCLAYHSIHCVKGYAGVSIENTYRITDTGCEALTKWPFDDLLVVGF
jgi:Xaa-Pro aminopeptidase